MNFTGGNKFHAGQEEDLFFKESFVSWINTFQYLWKKWPNLVNAQDQASFENFISFRNLSFQMRLDREFRTTNLFFKNLKSGLGWIFISKWLRTKIYDFCFCSMPCKSNLMINVLMFNLKTQQSRSDQENGISSEMEDPATDPFRRWFKEVYSFWKPRKEERLLYKSDSEVSFAKVFAQSLQHNRIIYFAKWDKGSLLRSCS